MGSLCFSRGGWDMDLPQAELESSIAELKCPAPKSGNGLVMVHLVVRVSGVLVCGLSQHSRQSRRWYGQWQHATKNHQRDCPTTTPSNWRLTVRRSQIVRRSGNSSSLGSGAGYSGQPSSSSSSSSSNSSRGQLSSSRSRQQSLRGRQRGPVPVFRTCADSIACMWLKLARWFPHEPIPSTPKVAEHQLDWVNACLRQSPIWSDPSKRVGFRSKQVFSAMLPPSRPVFGLRSSGPSLRKEVGV